MLGGKSQLLDLGRRRGFSPSQRLVMAIRQGGVCSIQGCERPATWADANHRTPWAHGGHATVENGELICPRHHTLVHQGRNYPGVLNSPPASTRLADDSAPRAGHAGAAQPALLAVECAC